MEMLDKLNIAFDNIITYKGFYICSAGEIKHLIGSIMYTSTGEHKLYLYDSRFNLLGMFDRISVYFNTALIGRIDGCETKFNLDGEQIDDTEVQRLISKNFSNISFFKR